MNKARIMRAGVGHCSDINTTKRYLLAGLYISGLRPGIKSSPRSGRIAPKGPLPSAKLRWQRGAKHRHTGNFMVNQQFIVEE